MCVWERKCLLAIGGEKIEVWHAPEYNHRSVVYYGPSHKWGVEKKMGLYVREMRGVSDGDHFSIILFFS